jgi:hypothetical protein
MLINTSSLIGDIRGSLGSSTIKMNRSGLTLQRKSYHSPNNLFPSNDINFSLQQLNHVWKLSSQATRNLWAEAAFQEVATNNMGRSIKLSGWNLFCKRNLLLLSLQQSVASFPLAPSPLGEIVILAPEFNTGTGQITASITDYPATQCIAILASAPLSPGIAHKNVKLSTVYKEVGTGLPHVANFTTEYQRIFGTWWLNNAGNKIMVSIKQIFLASGKITVEARMYTTII